MRERYRVVQCGEHAFQVERWEEAVLAQKVEPSWKVVDTYRTLDEAEARVWKLAWKLKVVGYYDEDGRRI